MELIFSHLDIFFFVKRFSHPLQANFCSKHRKKVQDITLHYVDCIKKKPENSGFFPICNKLSCYKFIKASVQGHTDIHLL